MEKNRHTSGFTLINFLIGVTIVIFLLMTLYVVLGFLGVFSLAKETVCQSNRGILKNTYQMYSIVENKKVEDHTIGVGFLIAGGYMTTAQSESGSLSQMVWRVYDNGTVDVFCSVNEADQSASVIKSSFFEKDNVLPLKGSWKTGNGVLFPVSDGENRAIFKKTSGTDYTIEINVEYLGGDPKNSGYGIYYRVTEIVNISGYIFQFDPGKGKIFAVRKVAKGKEGAIFQQISMVEVMGSDFDIYLPHVIKIVLEGQNQIISVDGVQILNFSDPTFSSGSVGIRSWNDSNVRFNEVKVTKK